MTRWIRIAFPAAVLLVCATAFAAKKARSVPSFVVPRHVIVYETGLEFARTKVWSDVARQMEGAIGMNPVEGAVAISPRRMASYTPHYWLGRARYQIAYESACGGGVCDSIEFVPFDERFTDARISRAALGKASLRRTSPDDSQASIEADLQAAIAAFDRSEQQGYIQNFPQDYAYLRLLRGRARFLLRRSVSERDLRQRVLQAVAGQPPAESGALAPLFDSIALPIVTTLSEHEELASMFESRGADEDLAQLLPSRDPRELARDSDEIARRRLWERLQQQASFARNAATFIAAADLEPPAVAVNDLRQAAATAAMVKPGAPAAEITQALKDIQETIASAGAVMDKVSKGALPSPSLFKGASLFFAGDYAAADTTLAHGTFRDDRETAQAQLLLAASRHAQYRAGGETDPLLLGQAVDAVKECRRLDPSLAPTVAFSQAFRSFFEKPD